MTAVPDTHDFTDGVATSSEANAYIRDPIRFLLNLPIAELTATAAQLHNSTGNFLDVNWGAETVDSANGHDNSTANSRYTAVYAGWYLCSASVQFAANSTGRRGVRYAVNGTAVNSTSTLLAATSANSVIVSARAKLIYLNVGDYVTVQAFQDSGGNLNINTTADPQNGGFTIKWASN